MVFCSNLTYWAENAFKLPKHSVQMITSYQENAERYRGFLIQRSKITWLLKGDDNNAYFHACIKKRREENRIVSYLNEQGEIVDDYGAVVQHFLNHFRGYMGGSSSANGFFNAQSMEFGSCLDIEQQLRLTRSFGKADVKKALLSIPGVKSPGPDGFGAEFYKTMWLDIGDDISDAVLGFFRDGKIPEALNETMLALVPKTDSPIRVVDYRPIACCNTLYKCISKMICSRLSEVLPHLISQNQGAFVRGRSLAHNILIIQDLIKNYNRKNSSPRCALKIDLSKAYDTVDWLLQLGAQQQQEFRYHPLCKGLKIINLCFADDLVIFCKANSGSVQVVKQVFEEFCNSTGLKANSSKSQVFFGGVSVAVRNQLLKLVQLEEGIFPLKYLGVPMRPTKWKMADCDEILKKIKLRLHTWASRHLSYAGRVQLITSVLLGLRNYWMNIFLLPQSIVKEVDKLCLWFFWGNNGTRSNFHLTSWTTVCLPKRFGGLGFGEGSKWNKAMLAKYVWAINNQLETLWVKWINSVYLKGQSFWQYKLKNDTSWYWRKICMLRDVFSQTVIDAAVR
ncbi:uncharacterized protein LOC133806725 [Humulus lupulus]|uniref:uncharacterized protein LOC133806725 n=1 Tax=Humulus lupulus TaxID=3486 RepID=UPI002B40CD67|nr:uncharacterized protein LOC133806725 [Humulus lupulus]